MELQKSNININYLVSSLSFVRISQVAIFSLKVTFRSIFVCFSEQVVLITMHIWLKGRSDVIIFITLTFQKKVPKPSPPSTLQLFIVEVWPGKFFCMNKPTSGFWWESVRQGTQGSFSEVRTHPDGVQLMCPVSGPPLPGLSERGQFPLPRKQNRMIIVPTP